MKNLRNKIIALALVCAMIISVTVTAAPTNAYAASTKAATAYNGKYTYFAVYNTIYKLNSESGKKSKVVTIDKIGNVYDIVYNKGYLYFTANYFFGTGEEWEYICRIKANGTGFKKLGAGYHPQVVGSKIYYVRTTKVKNGEFFYFNNKSIASMSLNGKNKKNLVKLSKNDNQNVFYVGGSLFFYKKEDDNYRKKLAKYDIKSKKTTVIDTAVGGFDILGADNKALYYVDDNNVKMYEAASGNISSYSSSDARWSFFGGKDGKIYYSGYDYDNHALYELSFKTGKMKKISSKYGIDFVIYSKSGYNIYYRNYSQEEFEATNYMKDIEVARMKPNGKKYKALIKYYIS